MPERARTEQPPYAANLLPFSLFFEQALRWSLSLCGLEDFGFWPKLAALLLYSCSAEEVAFSLIIYPPKLLGYETLCHWFGRSPVGRAARR